MSILDTPAKFVEAPKPYLKLREYPDAMLKQKSLPWLDGVTDNLEFQELVAAMVRTMEAAKAVGISGPQVGIPFRVFAVVRNGGSTLVAVNPMLTATTSLAATSKEYCLSFPGVGVKVERLLAVELDYTDMNGNPQTIELEGAEAQVAQHEMDHLEGITFIDRIPKVMRSKALEDMRNFKKIYVRRMEAYKKAAKLMKMKGNRK